mmetsp:Transcript_4664/g.8184  ORF Transcript_4664/g.8184 Transcript_4664/m.8184 type:complete len:104 (+) Transcript_4664:854-1165(+)
MYSFLMIRKKLFYNIHYADYACISGTLPHDSGSTTTFVFIRPACGNNYSTLLHKKHEDHSIHDGCSHRSLLFFYNKKKRINHYDLLFAFTVEPSTNHSRDSSC